MTGYLTGSCFLLLFVAFAGAQYRRTATGRPTTSSTTQSQDYSDYSDPTDAPTTRAAYRRLQQATTGRKNQAKVNIRPVYGGGGQAGVRVGGSASSSSSSSSSKASYSSSSSRLAGPLSVQTQDPWKALDSIRGRSALLTDEILNLMLSATPGVDFPTLSQAPNATTFHCENQKQPGFYADPDFQCQVFRRCDPSGILYSFLCPNTTIFNQITLTCDYWFNVDCAKSVDFYDFSNARLYHENWPLLGSISANTIA